MLAGTPHIFHHEKVVQRMTGVVCGIPIKSGFCYTGQTGQCINQRMTEHCRNVKFMPPSHNWLIIMGMKFVPWDLGQVSMTMTQQEGL